MKIFAQHGSNAGDRIETALSKNLIDGVIFSPRDISFDNLKAKLQTIKKSYPKVEKYLDPQFYATFLAGDSDSRLGHLLSDGYNSYFRGYRRSQLESEKVVAEVLRLAFEFQAQLEVDAIIAPNILVPRSFDSIHAFISKNFVRLTRTVFKELKMKKPVYATIAVSRDALCDKKELEEFIKDITALKDPPDGFYILVSSQSSESRTDIYNADVIAGWMRINHSLKLNGFKVLNGYSDILTVLLGAAGADAGATGWWSNLRTFSLGKFEAAEGGGRLPNQRYLSKSLLNRITYFELHALRNEVPEVLNGLSRDSDYNEDLGSMPERSLEVFQSWEAIKSLVANISGSKRADDLKMCLRLINQATNVYDLIAAKKVRLDAKSNGEHLKSMEEGVNLFRERAEIQFPKD
jgi:hypothetical protein